MKKKLKCKLKLDLQQSIKSETRSERTSRISAHTTNTIEIGKLLVVVHPEMYEEN